jgi:hypothetical protein
MAIKSIEENLGLPRIAGKIRLGERAGDKKYPQNIGYFNLKDAPEVSEAYRDMPETFVDGDPRKVNTLHIRFAHPQRFFSAPYFYKKYGAGKTDPMTKEIIGGPLKCKGDGEVALHYEKRDPITREVPQRQCLGHQCPDFERMSPEGKKIAGCSESMNIFVTLPLVNPYNIYQIDTLSTTNVFQFQNELKYLEETKGRVDTIIYSIFRYQKNMSGKWVWLLGLKENLKFKEIYQEKIEMVMSQIESSHYFLPRYSAAVESAILPQIEAPMEDNYPVQDTPEVISGFTDEQLKIICMEPEIISAFEPLAISLGKENSERNRFLTIKNFKDTNDPRSELLRYLESKISESNRPR